MTTEAELGEVTAGVWSHAQARAAGLSEGAIARRVQRGLWQRPQRGVYADAGVEPSPLMRGWAVVLARGGHGRAWATGRTLARMLELPLIDDDDPATGAYDRVHDDVAVRSGRPGTSGTLHARRPAFTPGTDTVLVDGCPAMSLERALPGLAQVLSAQAMVCLLDAALHAQRLTASGLARVATAPRAPRALRRAAELADGRAESPAETLARLLLLPVLPGLEPQVRLVDAAARLVARFDLGDRALRLAVEADGRRGHAGEAMAAKDARRDRTSRRMGWRTERCTWFELRRRQAETVRRVVLAAREQSGRAT